MLHLERSLSQSLFLYELPVRVKVVDLLARLEIQLVSSLLVV